jgi:hypothetical protein
MNSGTALGFDSVAMLPPLASSLEKAANEQMNGEIKQGLGGGRDEGRTTQVELHHCIKLLPTRRGE